MERLGLAFMVRTNWVLALSVFFNNGLRDTWGGGHRKSISFLQKWFTIHSTRN